MEVRNNVKAPSALILIVNDEQAIRDFFRFNLQVRGYGVIDVSGGPGVIKIVEKEMPDLTILDLMVKSVDGFELCRRICSSPSPKVIAFNMRGGESDLLKCLDMGVEDYLGKPFGVEEMMARVRAVLGRQRLLKAAEPVKSVSWSKN